MIPDDSSQFQLVGPVAFVHRWLGTVLSGIAFGAIVLGVATLIGMTLDLRRGLLLGLAGFVCFVLAPSLGLPPKPPGVAGAELHAAQLWWSFAVISTGAGLWLLFHARTSWTMRGLGLMLRHDTTPRPAHARL